MIGKNTLGKLQKVYLPKYVLDIFEQDIEVFDIKRNGKKNLSKFCNLIFENMKDEFLAEKIKVKNLFVDKWLENKLPKVLAEKYNMKIDESDELIKDIKSQLDEVLQLVFKPEKMKYHDYISFRLNNENTFIFDSIIRRIGSSFSLSDYFRNLFLSYSLKPQFEREKIIFKKNYNEILQAIKNRTKIEIEVYGLRYKIINEPCFIKENIEGSFNYIVCIGEKGKIKAPRLSSIKTLINLKEINFELTIEQKEELENLKDNFDPFLNEIQEIKIKLSKRGVYKYKRMVHNRPKVSYIKNRYIYIFNCSPDKIRAYFFKFGEDAIILEPNELAKKFRREYLKAHKKYDYLDKHDEKEKRKRLKKEYKKLN